MINGKWWLVWVQNLKWPCVRMESGHESGFKMGSGGQSGCGIWSEHVQKWTVVVKVGTKVEVAMHANGKWLSK